MVTHAGSALRVVVVVGTRPNFVKAGPIVPALERRGHDVRLVHTGQHYDTGMSETFLRDFGLPDPHHFLGVGSGSHAETTARVMLALEPVLEQIVPDWVVVVGDVDSTLAASLVTAKLQPAIGCRLAHVEAGLRSGNWSMPEEVNRVLTDRLADLLLTPSRDAAGKLEAEGIPEGRVTFVGNVMIDTLFSLLPRARERAAAAEHGLTPRRFVLATLHRPANVDDAAVLDSALAGLRALAADTDVVIPLHPRTRRRIDGFGLGHALKGLRVLPPIGYLDMLSLMDDAQVVLTDSGGIQEETTVLGVPCVTLRAETERPVTVTAGTNALAHWPPTPDDMVEQVARAGGRERRSSTPAPVEALRARAIEGWDGRAGERVAAALEDAAPGEGGRGGSR
jgi:UDP-N-acetylglucosamine 2-epimerase (non-hydrolysing)